MGRVRRLALNRTYLNGFKHLKGLKGNVIVNSSDHPCKDAIPDSQWFPQKLCSNLNKDLSRWTTKHEDYCL